MAPRERGTMGLFNGILREGWVVCVCVMKDVIEVLYIRYEIKVNEIYIRIVSSMTI